jgi:DNA-binding IclR family transcriptional regulator
MLELAAIRKNDAAFSRGEWVSGVNAVAVPVADSSRNLIGVLSCFGPAERIPEGSLKRLQRTLSLKAQELSRHLGE